MKRVVLWLFAGGVVLGVSQNGWGIERVLKPDSSPEERVRVAKQYKDVEIPLGDSVFAIVNTNKGTFKVILYPKDAPITVQNFVRLSLLGFYDGLTFHRYVPNFVIQGGDPYGKGYGDAGYTIPLEISERKHVMGALGMARAQDPNSGSCQWYITLKATPFLDGKYTVFGKVIEGMDVVLKLRQGDVIERIDIEGVESQKE